MIPGINSYMFHGLPLKQIFALTSQIGCRYLSIEIEHLSNPELLKFADLYKVKINAAGSLFLNCDCFIESVEYGKKIIDLCGLSHISTLVIVIQSDDDGYEWILNAVQLCRQLADYADTKSITIAIEPLAPELRRVTCLTQLYLANVLCDYVKRDNFGIILDTYHCGGMQNAEFEIEKILSNVVGVHFSDRNLKGEACFPGTGVLPIKRWLDLIGKNGFKGVLELEIVNPALIYDELENTKLFKSSFLQYSNITVIGELAVHQFYDENKKCIEQNLGGSAGMIVSQLCNLGVFPHLIGICGDDFWGDLIQINYAKCTGWSDIMKQSGGRTSRVSILKEDIEILAGNIDAGNLESFLNDVEDSFQYCYLPMFPGYEKLYDVLVKKKQFNLICDFGYYAWCGDQKVIQKKLFVASGGYCALINTKDMVREEKIKLLKYALSKGYKYAISTDGQKNVLLAKKDKIIEYAVIKADSIGSTCGAGDCMVAGILYMLKQNYSMEDAVCFGIHVAYQKVQVLGVWNQADRREYGGGLYKSSRKK